MVSDEYALKVWKYLEKLPPNRTIKVRNICTEKNRVQFIEAVKMYIDSHQDCGISFITDKYEKFHKIEVIK